jgi:hypothetical protein
MPGTGIPDFAKHAKAIADAGIYDFAAHHDHILQPIGGQALGPSRALEGLTPEAEEARASTLEFIRRVGKAGARMAERRAARAAKAAERAPVPRQRLAPGAPRPRRAAGEHPRWSAATAAHPSAVHRGGGGRPRWCVPPRRVRQ